MTESSFILKHPLRVRVFHYILAASFLTLAVTGVMLYFKLLAEPAMNTAMQVHVVAGVVLTMDALAFFFLAFDRLVLFTKRTFTFSGNDIKWFTVLGGYPQKILLHKKVAVPPMGKYNAGQKLFGICVLVGGTLLILSGWVLWTIPHAVGHGAASLAGSIHVVASWVLILFLFVHLFLGIYMWDDFKAMFVNGRIPCEDAAEKAPLWVKNDLQRLC